MRNINPVPPVIRPKPKLSRLKKRDPKLIIDASYWKWFGYVQNIFEPRKLRRR